MLKSAVWIMAFSRNLDLGFDVKAHQYDSTECFLQKTLAEWELWTLISANIDFKEGGISPWQDGRDTSGMLELVGGPVTIKSGLPASPSRTVEHKVGK